MSIPSQRIAAIASHLRPGPAPAAGHSQPAEAGTRGKQLANRSELNPVSLLARSERLFPARTAFVHADNGHARADYATFAARVRSFASALIDTFAVAKGDRVAVLMPNNPCILEANFAVPLCLAQLVSINTRLLAPEVEYILTLSEAKVLLVDKDLVHLTENYKACGVAHRIVVSDAFGLPNAPEKDEYEALIASGLRDGVVQRGWDDFPPLESEDDVISINFTSGTTGKPKGVMYHYRGAYLNSLCLSLELGMNCETNYLWILPMFHASGWCFPWAVTAVGGAHTLLRRVDYTQIWDLLRHHAITHYCGAPTVQLSIANHPSATSLPKEVKTMVAAAPPSPTLLESLLRLHITPLHVYGLTETYGPSTVCAWQPEWRALAPDALAQKLARQGHAFLACDALRVLDAQGRDVPRDGRSVGEVVFSGNLVMKGYLNDAEATAKAFRDGVFWSGDVGVVHPDGYVELRDRQKDIIISGGENIATIEIEQAIVAHPAVLETCVVSSPDTQWGERPVAYVTLKQPLPQGAGAEAVFEKELLLFLRTRLAGFKLPVRAHVLAELPKTSTGKIQKFVLRDREWAKAGKGDGDKKING
ncbi:AMP-dependent synthetase and ligase [Chytriomyces sp. MP71]|nr:AMP-dependent synthetase and ligase [Chytriomyces sp. MP71]